MKKYAPQTLKTEAAGAGLFALGFTLFQQYMTGGIGAVDVNLLLPFLTALYGFLKGVHEKHKRA